MERGFLFIVYSMEKRGRPLKKIHFFGALSGVGGIRPSMAIADEYEYAWLLCDKALLQCKQTARDANGDDDDSDIGRTDAASTAYDSWLVMRRDLYGLTELKKHHRCTLSSWRMNQRCASSWQNT